MLKKMINGIYKVFLCILLACLCVTPIILALYVFGIVLRLHITAFILFSVSTLAVTLALTIIEMEW